MDKMYSLTELGKRTIRAEDGDGPQWRILHYLEDNKVATDSTLEVIGGKSETRHLARRGYIKELTT